MSLFYFSIRGRDQLNLATHANTLTKGCAAVDALDVKNGVVIFEAATAGPAAVVEGEMISTLVWIGNNNKSTRSRSRTQRKVGNEAEKI